MLPPISAYECHLADGSSMALDGNNQILLAFAFLANSDPSTHQQSHVATRIALLEHHATGPGFESLHVACDHFYIAPRKIGEQIHLFNHRKQLGTKRRACRNESHRWQCRHSHKTPLKEHVMSHDLKIFPALAVTP